MGSTTRLTIFGDHVQQHLKGWAKRAKAQSAPEEEPNSLHSAIGSVLTLVHADGLFAKKHGESAKSTTPDDDDDEAGVKQVRRPSGAAGYVCAWGLVVGLVHVCERFEVPSLLLRPLRRISVKLLLFLLETGSAFCGTKQTWLCDLHRPEGAEVGKAKDFELLFSLCAGDAGDDRR